MTVELKKNTKFQLLEPPKLMAKDEVWNEFFKSIENDEFFDLQYLESYRARAAMIEKMCKNTHSQRYRVMMDRRRLGAHNASINSLKVTKNAMPTQFDDDDEAE